MDTLPMSPYDATKQILSNLPSRRMKNVIEKRFGLKGGRHFTLDAIGKEYKITRERVRQIEADALNRLKKVGDSEEFSHLISYFQNHIHNHGEVMAEDSLFSSLVESRYRPHLAFILHIGKPFHRVLESDVCRDRWTINKDKISVVEKIMSAVMLDLDAKKQPVSKEELLEIAAKNSKEALGEAAPREVLDVYLATSKLIGQNPYGEYGLISWPVITPRGVKDRAFVVLEKNKKPMHFREVAEAINKVGWSKKKAHPQTVHNELIKDPRFVLVGRGLYALKEWGYEEGSVREILASVFKEANGSLTKDEVIDRVLKKRMVKEPTILLNLQNRSLFKKTGEGKYTLI